MGAVDFLENVSGDLFHIKLTKENLAQLLIGQELKGFKTKITMVEE